MAHALAPRLPAARKLHRHHSSPPAVGVVVLGRPGPSLARQPQQQQQQHGTSIPALHLRRTFVYGLVGVGLGSAAPGGEANAASRRPPPPPPTEKKDPNVSGVQAKVLASKKRKEAMKEAMAQLRERGKPISEPGKEPVKEPSNKPPQ